MRYIQINQEFGLLRNTTAVSKVLEGTYIYLEGSSKSVVGMLKMIEEVDVGVRDSMVDIVINLQDYIKYWKGCREKTPSFVSGIHLGHWNNAASSNEVAELHAMMTHMKFQSGNPLTQWCKGLQVILQNIAGSIKMERQRAMLLIGSDFNFGNKLYFGSRIIKKDMGHGLVPPKQHGLRDHNLLEVVLTKTLFNDMTRQKICDAAEGSFDAHTCLK